MKKILLLAVALVLPLAAEAQVAEPSGLWLVKDGTARIRIGPCGDALWGVIDWTQHEGGIDRHNPDPAKRGRPIVGVAILLGMKLAQPNEWRGEVYNAENGKIYDARISLKTPDVLSIKGCVLGGLFCGGEDWTRVKDQTTSGSKAGAGGRTDLARRSGAAASPARVCPQESRS
jgi:uncharacterized protein (DUF2147 family)